MRLKQQSEIKKSHSLGEKLSGMGSVILVCRDKTWKTKWRNKNNCIKHLHCRLTIQILFEAERTSCTLFLSGSCISLVFRTRRVVFLPPHTDYARWWLYRILITCTMWDITFQTTAKCSIQRLATTMQFDPRQILNDYTLTCKLIT